MPLHHGIGWMPTRATTPPSASPLRRPASPRREETRCTRGARVLQRGVRGVRARKGQGKARRARRCETYVRFPLARVPAVHAAPNFPKRRYSGDTIAASPWPPPAARETISALALRPARRSRLELHAADCFLHAVVHLRPPTLSPSGFPMPYPPTAPGRRKTPLIMLFFISARTILLRAY